MYAGTSSWTLGRQYSACYWEAPLQVSKIIQCKCKITAKSLFLCPSYTGTAVCAVSRLCQCFLADTDCLQAPTGSKVTLCLYSLWFSLIHVEQLSCNTVKQSITACLPEQVEFIYLPLKYQIVVGYTMAFPHCSWSLYQKRQPKPV